jgi:hypothetical protein
MKPVNDGADLRPAKQADAANAARAKWHEAKPRGCAAHGV